MEFDRERQHKVMAEALWHVDAVADKSGWDQEPGVYTVAMHSMPEVQVTDESVAVAMIAISAIPGWDQCLQAAKWNPSHALELLISGLASCPSDIKRGAFPLEDMYGVAMIVESWAVSESVDASKEKIDELFKAQQEHRLDKHPDRVEVRLIYLVSLDGVMAVLSHERDGIVKVYGEDSTEEVTGSVPQQISRLVMTIKEQGGQ